MLIVLAEPKLGPVWKLFIYYCCSCWPGRRNFNKEEMNYPLSLLTRIHLLLPPNCWTLIPPPPFFFFWDWTAAVNYYRKPLIMKVASYDDEWGTIYSFNETRMMIITIMIIVITIIIVIFARFELKLAAAAVRFSAEPSRKGIAAFIHLVSLFHLFIPPFTLQLGLIITRPPPLLSNKTD